MLLPLVLELAHRVPVLLPDSVRSLDSHKSLRLGLRNTDPLPMTDSVAIANALRHNILAADWRQGLQGWRITTADE